MHRAERGLQLLRHPCQFRLRLCAILGPSHGVSISLRERLQLTVARILSLLLPPPSPCSPPPLASSSPSQCEWDRCCRGEARAELRGFVLVRDKDVLFMLHGAAEWKGVLVTVFEFLYLLFDRTSEA
eukprot:3559401-Rhodomonas_salina.1